MKCAPRKTKYATQWQRRRERKEDQLGFWAFINFDGVGVVLGVVVVGGKHLSYFLIQHMEIAW